MATTCVGTPYYLSPELCMGSPYGAKADIWAVGCIAFELLALRLPFEATNIAMLVMRIVQGQRGELPSSTSPDLARVVDCALRVDVESRPSAEDLLAMESVGQKLALWRAVELDVVGAELASLAPAGLPAPPMSPLSASSRSLSSLDRRLSIASMVAGNHRVFRWGAGQHKPRLFGHLFQHDVRRIVAGPDGFAALSSDGTLLSWNTSERRIPSPESYFRQRGISVNTAAIGVKFGVASDQQGRAFVWGDLSQVGTAKSLRVAAEDAVAKRRASERAEAKKEELRTLGRDKEQIASCATAETAEDGANDRAEWPGWAREAERAGSDAAATNPFAAADDNDRTSSSSSSDDDDDDGGDDDNDDGDDDNDDGDSNDRCYTGSSIDNAPFSRAHLQPCAAPPAAARDCSNSSVISDGTIFAAAQSNESASCAKGIGVEDGSGSRDDDDAWSFCGSDEDADEFLEPRIFDGPFRSREVVDVAAGSNFFALLTSDGELYTVGQNDYGQLGVGDADHRETLTRVKLPHAIVKGMACGSEFMLALDGAGSLYSWGLGVDGQLARGCEVWDEPQPTPLQVVGISGEIVDFAAGERHAAAASIDGELFFRGGTGTTRRPS